MAGTIGFKGGDAMRAKLEELAARVSKADTVRVGFLEGATYPDGTSVPFVAAMNEYGHLGTPPRPFFRNMIREKSPQWGESMGNVMRANNYDADTALRHMGEGIRGQLQESINKFDSVPLADSTLARKEFPKQLIDTAVMINAVDYEVNE